MFIVNLLLKMDLVNGPKTTKGLAYLETWFPLVLPRPLLHFSECSRPSCISVGHVGQEAHWIQPWVWPQAWDAGLGLHEASWGECSMWGQRCVHVTTTKGVYAKDGASTLLRLVSAVASVVSL